MNYSELKLWIADSLHRDDLSGVIPNFIALAESDMQLRLSKEPCIYEWATATTVANNPLVDAVGMYRLMGASIAGKPLRIVTPGFIRPNSGSSGRPDMLAFESASSLRFYPTPDAAYTIDVLHCPVISPSLAGGSPSESATNWILQLVPGAYQYGAMAHAAIYLQDMDKVAMYKAAYDQSMDILIASRRHGDIADSPDPLWVGMLDNDTWSIRNG